MVKLQTPTKLPNFAKIDPKSILFLTTDTVVPRMTRPNLDATSTLGSALAWASSRQYSDLRAQAPEGADVECPDCAFVKEEIAGETASWNDTIFGWAQKIMCSPCRREELLDAAESGDLEKVQVSSCPLYPHSMSRWPFCVVPCPPLGFRFWGRGLGG